MLSAGCGGFPDCYFNVQIMCLPIVRILVYSQFPNVENYFLYLVALYWPLNFIAHRLCSPYCGTAWNAIRQAWSSENPRVRRPCARCRLIHVCFPHHSDIVMIQATQGTFGTASLCHEHPNVQGVPKTVRKTLNVRSVLPSNLVRKRRSTPQFSIPHRQLKHAL
jgi:hypothetical protein